MLRAIGSLRSRCVGVDGRSNAPGGVLRTFVRRYPREDQVDEHRDHRMIKNIAP